MSDNITAPSSQSCAKHPSVAGPFACGHCGQNFCVECCYSLPDGTISCHECYARAAAPVATPSAAAPGGLRVSLAAAQPAARFEETALPGQGCLQHPTVSGIYQCSFCGARSCLTCDFYFLPDTHACPICASASAGNLSPLRKKNMIGSLIAGSIASVVMVIFFSGLLERMNPALHAIMAEVLFRLILFPAAIGAGLGLAAFKKGRTNTIGIWLALIWNFVLMIGVFALAVIGLFMQGE